MIIGNTENKTCHMANCKFAPKKYPKRIEFDSLEDAYDKKYKDCSFCKPRENKDVYNIENDNRFTISKEPLPFGGEEFFTEEISEDFLKNIFIGNLSNKSYHLPSCTFAPKISSKKIEFKSIVEANKNGYKPCSTCNPNT